MEGNGFGYALGLLLLFLPFSGAAQTPAPAEPKIQELSGDRLTSENLIQVLQPAEEAPPEYRVRGSKAKPKCEFFQKQRGPNPVATIAAIPILFPYDSAELTPEAMKDLDQLGTALTSNRLAPCCFEIEGHTDDRGSDEYNLGLSERRARSVIDYLVRTFGIDGQRLTPVGRGEKKPIADNGSEAGRTRNRRVQVVNLGYGEVGG